MLFGTGTAGITKTAGIRTAGTELLELQGTAWNHILFYPSTCEYSRFQRCFMWFLQFLWFWNCIELLEPLKLVESELLELLKKAGIRTARTAGTGTAVKKPELPMLNKYVF